MHMPATTLVAIYWHSITHLRASMIAWRVHRTIKGAAIALVERAGAAALLSRPRTQVRARRLPPLTSVYHCEDIDVAARRYSFLMDVETLPADRTARRAAVARKPLLWQFHYGYHDWLLALVDAGRLSLADAIAAARTWSDDHPLALRGARRSAWHAYVLSLRIEAWVRLHARAREAGIGEEDPDLRHLAAGVEHMTRVLLRNLERGTMANHLFKNIKALVLAGCLLDHATGHRALRIGMRLLERELAEQVLDDGMHFERSPMYHTQMTSDVVDLFELLAQTGDPVPPLLARSARAMTDFLARSLHPDSDVPYFNDATASFFLRPAEVAARGADVCARFGLVPRPAAPDADAPAGEIDPLRHSGLFFCTQGDLRVVFDAGNVGPDYQPGHAHCDTLAYEIVHRGARVCTDTGVYHYRESDERTHARSTAAHSTLRIDGAEQSEIWKSFRVGRRARVLHARDERRDDVRIFRAAHDGYTRLAEGMVHERVFIIGGDAWICVVDVVAGAGVHRLENYVQLAPACRATVARRGVQVEAPSGAFTIESLEGIVPVLQRSEYYPAFGVKQARSTVVFREDATLPHTTGYLIVFDPARAPERDVWRRYL